MKKIEIPLQQRKEKFVLTIIAAVLIGSLLVSSVISMVTKGFDVYSGFIAALMLFGFIMVLMNISDYNKMKGGNLTVESDGVIMRFYISHKTGTANKSNSIRLENMKRFYVVSKKTRYFMVNKLFAFEPKTGITNKQIEVFPSLMEINELGFSEVMGFVNRVAPDIALGYNGSTLANLFKRG